MRGAKFQSLACVCSLALGYLFFLGKPLWDPAVWVVHDNLWVHFSNFMYTALSLRHGFGIPSWYPSFGGIPFGISFIQFFPLFPHRWLGYLFYNLLPLPAIVIYKLALVAGLLLFSAGWWLFLHRLTSSRLGASFGVWILLCGGIGITVFHQEQIIATLTWVPWMLLAFSHRPVTYKTLFAAAVFLGLLLCSHYPQIHMIWLAAAGGVLLVRQHARQLIGRAIRHRAPSKLILLCVVFVLSSSPMIYLAIHKNQFASPMRMTDSLETQGMEHYLFLNRMQASSAPWHYWPNYLWPKTEGLVMNRTDDRFVCFVTVIGLFLAGWGLVRQWSRTKGFFAMLVFLAWAALGINGFLAQILFVIRFPLVSYFRQWCHFLPLVNLGLSVLAAFGVSDLVAIVKKRAGHKEKGKWWVVVVAAAVFFVAGIEGQRYWRVYVRDQLDYRHEVVDARKPTQVEFLELMKDEAFSADVLHITFVYREWNRVLKNTPWLLFRWPFITSTVFQSGLGIEDDRFVARTKEFVDEEKSPLVVVGVSDERRLRLTGLGYQVIPSAGLLSDQDVEPLRFVDRMEYDLTPRGAVWGGQVKEPSLLVLPFAYPLKLRVSENRLDVPTYPVYDGAFTGVFLEPGLRHVEVRAPVTGYHVMFLVQAVLVLLVIISWGRVFSGKGWAWLNAGLDG